MPPRKAWLTSHLRRASDGKGRRPTSEQAAALQFLDSLLFGCNLWPEDERARWLKQRNELAERLVAGKLVELTAEGQWIGLQLERRLGFSETCGSLLIFAGESKSRQYSDFELVFLHREEDEEQVVRRLPTMGGHTWLVDSVYADLWVSHANFLEIHLKEDS